MNSRGRNPIAQSAALAVLGVALVGALILGAMAFAALFGVFIAGYLVSMLRAYWRLIRLRSRAVYVDRASPARFIEDLEVAAAIADAGPRGSGGSA